MTGTVVIGPGEPDEARYDAQGRVSGRSLTLFFLGWTRPSTGYRHRLTNTTDVSGDQMEGVAEEQRGEWTGDHTLTRQ